MRAKASQQAIQPKQNELLSTHSYINIGGKADFYFEPQNLQDLQSILAFCAEKDLPYRVIGGGCNILFSDKGFRGCIISMVSFEKNCFEQNGTEVKVSASLKTSSFVRKCDAGDLSGMEFLSFIPGTIGGVLAMNAGCLNYTTEKYNEVSDFVRSVVVFDQNKIRSLDKSEITFGYRESSLKDFIILFGTFQLSEAPLQNFKEELSRNYQERAKKMPMKNPSLGSMFKNPEGTQSAGQLIEEAGLKGMREGDIIVSEQHGNVFENLGEGAASDVLKLVRLIQEAVKEKFNISLELEVDYIE